jgi:hypothetical protein
MRGRLKTEARKNILESFFVQQTEFSLVNFSNYQLQVKKFRVREIRSEIANYPIRESSL